jgi:hypothetical protein
MVFSGQAVSLMRGLGEFENAVALADVRPFSKPTHCPLQQGFLYVECLKKLLLGARPPVQELKNSVFSLMLWPNSSCSDEGRAHSNHEDCA